MALDDAYEGILWGIAETLYADEKARSATAMQEWEHLPDTTQEFYYRTARMVATVVLALCEAAGPSPLASLIQYLG